jgi:hypothetical protein
VDARICPVFADPGEDGAYLTDHIVKHLDHRAAA